MIRAQEDVERGALLQPQQSCGSGATMWCMLAKHVIPHTGTLVLLVWAYLLGCGQQQQAVLIGLVAWTTLHRLACMWLDSSAPSSSAAATPPRQKKMGSSKTLLQRQQQGVAASQQHVSAPVMMQRVREWCAQSARFQAPAVPGAVFGGHDARAAAPTTA